MRSKIIIHLGPKNAIPLDLSFLNFRKGIPGIIDALDLLNICLVYLFLLSTIVLEFFGLAGGGNLEFVIYAAVIIFMVIHLIKLLLSKQNYLNQIPYDIPLLSFTTLIAFSLFMGTAVFQNTTNIWGGQALRMISGVTLIGFWFLYYFLSTTINHKEYLQRALIAFWLAPIIALLCWLLTFSDFIPTQKAVLSLLLPATIWLVLTQNKHTWLHIANFVISLFILIVAKDKVAIFIDILIFLTTFLTIIIVKRKDLLELFHGLDRFPKNKQGFWDYVRQNCLPFYLIIAATSILVGIFWIKANLNSSLFADLYVGAKSLAFNNSGSLLLGNGLNTIAASTVLKFISTYGILPCLALLTAIIYIVRSQILAFKKTSSNANKGLIIWSLTLMSSLFCYLLISAANSETIILLLVIVILFMGLLQRFLFNKNELYLAPTLRSFANIKNPGQRLILKIVRIICILLVIFLAIYLLCSLNYINIFLNI